MEFPSDGISVENFKAQYVAWVIDGVGLQKPLKPRLPGSWIGKIGTQCSSCEVLNCEMASHSRELVFKEDF